MHPHTIRTRIFISSPFKGDLEGNAKRAAKYCKFASDQGYAPYAPHLICPQWLDDNNLDDREVGINIGLSFLETCIENWAFLPYGVTIFSEGMKTELEWATHLSIPTKIYREQKNGSITGPTNIDV